MRRTIRAINSRLIMYCLLRSCFHKSFYFISRVKLRCVLFCVGVIALLDFFGVFAHLFEVPYDDNFAYPYEGDIQTSVNALRRNEKPEIEPINEYKYNFIMYNPQKCTEAGYNLFQVVYVVKSALEHFDRRAAIRNTWGYEKRFFDVPLRTIFLVGVHPGDDELQARLKIEAAKYKDIVQANFVDSYYNNTIKTILGFKWLVKYCSNSRFYMFSDDDIYISVKNVLKFIRNPSKYSSYFKESKKFLRKREIAPSVSVNYRRYVNNFNYTSAGVNKVLAVRNFTIREQMEDNNERNDARKKREERIDGNFPVRNQLRSIAFDASVSNKSNRRLSNFQLPDDIKLFTGFVLISSPHRHKSSKWYVSLQEYPYHLWPPYVTAGAYILSKEALLDMYYTSFYTKHFRFDDIFLGLVAKKANIEPLHCEDFHFYKKGYTKYNYKYVITSHGYDDPNELLQVWNEQKALGNA